MKRNVLKQTVILSVMVTIVLALGLNACHQQVEPATAPEREGAAERAGQQVDRGIEKTRETIDRTRHLAESGSKTVAGYVDDSIITTKLKTALIKDREVSAFGIDVNTYHGVVQLSGFVDTFEQKQRAGDVAKTINGVNSVHNDLIVKPEPRS